MILVGALALWMAATSAAVFASSRPHLLAVQIASSCISIVAMGLIPVALMIQS